MPKESQQSSRSRATSQKSKWYGETEEHYHHQPHPKKWTLNTSNWRGKDSSVFLCWCDAMGKSWQMHIESCMCGCLLSKSQQNGSIWGKIALSSLAPYKIDQLSSNAGSLLPTIKLSTWGCCSSTCTWMGYNGLSHCCLFLIWNKSKFIAEILTQFEFSMQARQ